MSINKDLLAKVPTLNISAAAFKPYIVHGGLLYISGQLPMRDGAPAWKGSVPDVVSIDEAKQAAVLCTMNVLAWVKHACEGDFGKVERCIRLGGFVDTAQGFSDAPGIINAASEIMVEAFGERGAHARVALGVASLPFGAPVEVEALFALR